MRISQILQKWFKSTFRVATKVGSLKYQGGWSENGKKNKKTHLGGLLKTDWENWTVEKVGSHEIVAVLSAES